LVVFINQGLRIEGTEYMDAGHKLYNWPEPRHGCKRDPVCSSGSLRN